MNQTNDEIEQALSLFMHKRQNDDRAQHEHEEPPLKRLAIQMPTSIAPVHHDTKFDALKFAEINDGYCCDKQCLSQMTTFK